MTMFLTLGEVVYRLAVVLYGNKIESDFFLQLGFAETQTEIVAGKAKETS